MDDEEDKKLTKQDADLWKAMTGDVQRLPGKDYEEVSDEQAREQEFSDGGETIVPPRKTTKQITPSEGGLDRRTEERFRRGQMPIEARLDLHGLTQDQARPALEDFILRAHEQGKRCVLVITGKGKGVADNEDWLAPKPGVLKRRVPDWLAEAPIGDLILKTAPAKPRDGDNGALYILLRRQREI